MTTTPTTAPTGARASVVGAVVSGVAAYLFTIIAARVLGEVAYAPVGVLWTVQYLVLTVGLLSLEAWITREGTIPAVAWGWVVGLSALLGLGVHVAGAAVLGSQSAVWTSTAVIIGFGFGLFAVSRGHAAAMGDLRAYGMMTGGESLIRLLALLAVMAVGATAGGVALTLPAGAVLVSGWWLLVRGRSDVMTRQPARAAAQGTGNPVVATETSKAPLGFLVSTTGANASLQILLAGGPLVTAVEGAAAAVTSTVFVTTTAARAPLVLVYSGLLARLLRAVRALPSQTIIRRLRRLVLLAPVAVALAGGAGWVAGPPLIALAFGAELRPSPLFAAQTGAAIAAAILLLLGHQMMIAMRVAEQLVAPWSLAYVAAGTAAGLTRDLAPAERVGWLTLAGLLTAATVLAVLLLVHSRTALDAEDV